MMQSFLPNMFYYGFPVVLLSTMDDKGRVNITPITCTFTLGTNAVIALVKLNQAYENIKAVPEAVFNLPTSQMWEQVEAIAPYTAKDPVPAQKAAKYTHTDDKFALGYVLVELEFVQVHAEDNLVMDGDKINPLNWDPLIYNFKHYYSIGEHKGLNFTIK